MATTATEKVSVFTDNKWVVFSTLIVAMLMSGTALIGFLMEKSSVEAHIEEKVQFLQDAIEQEKGDRKEAVEGIWNKLHYIDEMRVDIGKLQEQIEHIKTNQTRILEKLDFLISR